MKVVTKSILILSVFVSSSVYSQVYHYVDETGRKVFVDSLSKVPSKYQSQINQRDEFTVVDPKKTLMRDIKGARLEQDRLKRELQDSMLLYQQPVRLIGGKPVVTVKISNGAQKKNVSFMLKSDSSLSLLSESTAAALSSSEPKWGVVNASDGKEYKGYRINIDNMSFGPYSFNYRDFLAVKASDLPSGVDGILGRQFLTSVKYSDGLISGKIIWEPEHYKNLQTKLEELELVIQKQEQVQKEVEQATDLTGRDIQLIKGATPDQLETTSASGAQTSVK